MPTELEVLKKNKNLQNKFYEYLDTNDKKIKEAIIPIIKELHNNQWTNGMIYNILQVSSNCYDNCKYCYMKRIKNNFFGTDIENLDMIVDEKKTKKNWKKISSEKSKIIMFPSSHDIFSEYLDEYIKTCKKIMDAGHTIMIVTKPIFDCISVMTKEFAKYKEKILFGLTITTDNNNNNVAKYYEPNAPNMDERIKCLKLLHKNKYRTSVSIEPFFIESKKDS